MPNLYSAQRQLQFILRSFASSGGGAEKPARDTASTRYATTPSATPDFIPYSQPQADTVAAACIPGLGDKIFPTVSHCQTVITLSPYKAATIQVRH